MQEPGATPRVHEATWRPTGLRFAAPADQPLLRSAEAAGLALPSSCRNGTCRTCLQPLVAGAVAYRIAWPGLLPEERAGGWLLPCVAHPVADVVFGGEPPA